MNTIQTIQTAAAAVLIGATLALAHSCDHHAAAAMPTAPAAQTDSGYLKTAGCHPEGCNAADWDNISDAERLRGIVLEP